MARSKNAEVDGPAAEQGRTALQRLLLRTQMSQSEIADCFARAGHPIEPRSMRRDLQCEALDEPLDKRRASLYVALSEYFEPTVVAPAMFAGLRRVDRALREASASLSGLLEDRIDAFAAVGRLPDRVVRWFDDPALEGHIPIELTFAGEYENDDDALKGPHNRIAFSGGKIHRLPPLNDEGALYWRITPGSVPRTEQELAAAFLPSLQRHLIRNFVTGLRSAAKARAIKRAPGAIRHLDRRMGSFPEIPYSPVGSLDTKPRALTTRPCALRRTTWSARRRLSVAITCHRARLRFRSARRKSSNTSSSTRWTCRRREVSRQ